MYHKLTEKLYFNHHKKQWPNDAIWWHRAGLTSAQLVVCYLTAPSFPWTHDEVIKWKHFPRYWPFVWGIHRSPVNSPHKGQWRGALMVFFICTQINGWVNNGEAGDLRCHRAHYDVIVMQCWSLIASVPFTLKFPRKWSWYQHGRILLKYTYSKLLPCCPGVSESNYDIYCTFSCNSTCTFLICSQVCW